MVGLELLLGLFALKIGRFSRLSPKTQVKALERLEHRKNRLIRPMVTLLKAMTCMSAYSQPKMLKKLGYNHEDKRSLQGCLS